MISPALLTEYTLYFTIAFTLIVSPLFIRRYNKENSEKAGCSGGAIFVFLISFFSFMFALVLPIFCGFLFVFTTFPYYTATIIDVESKWEEREDTEHNETYTVLVYIPTVSFIDRQGKRVQQRTFLSYETPHKVGTVMTVAYKNGYHLVECTVPVMGIVFVLFLVSLILMYFLAQIIYFITYQDPKKLHQLGGIGVYYVIIPSSLTIFLVAIIFQLYLHFTGAKVFPTWVIIFCIFSSTFILLGLRSYCLALWHTK